MEPAPSQPARAQSPWGERALNLWRLIVAVVLGYRGESLALRAGNLTFITITSLVPLVAVILALVHGFDSDHSIEKLVRGFFEDILSPGARGQSQPTIRKFLDAANSPAGGSLSFAVLLVSSAILLRHLDASLNEVWAVRHRRPLLISAALYFGALFIGPLLMVLTLLGTDTAKRFIVWAELPYSGFAFAVGSMAIAVGLLTSLFKIAPHAYVPWRSAFFGGAVAGAAFEVARHVYSSIASWFFSANPLYGSLSIAPLFLTWIYVVWYIVLSGARLAYAFEHADFHDEFKDLLAHPRSNELIATRIAALIAFAHAHTYSPMTVRSLAAVMRLPAQRVADLVFYLVDAGLLVKRKGELAPARSLDELSVADVSKAVGGTGLMLKRERVSRTGVFEGVASLFTAIDEVSVEKLKGISWSELAAREGESQKP